MESDFRQDLEIRPLGPEHVQQFNELLAYVFQITDADIEESGYDSKKEMIKSETTDFGLIQSLRLVSQDHRPAKSPFILVKSTSTERITKWAALTGVGTYPEYAGHGLMQELTGWP